MSTTDIIDGVLDPIAECLTPEAAQRILDFHADAETKARVDELAAKARSGTLKDKERSEYENYVEAFDLVALFKSKARSVLKGREG